MKKEERQKLDDTFDLIKCACYSPEHSIQIQYDNYHDEEPEVFLTIFLDNDVWYRRLWKGIKYIFGFKCSFGHFTEIVLNKDSVPVLKKVVNFLKDE